MPDAKVFSVRIVSIDYYMAPPIPDLDISYSSFHGGNVNEVPVIRIFGSTPIGQKTCLHVHRALPYLYIPCSDIGPIPDDEVDSRSNAISLALEKALKLKGNTGSKRQHVHGCSLVRARKFYGYHSSEELFVKIYFYYPQDVSRAANFLLAGAILDKILQPHESHIPFLLQFLIDYNLYGMGHLHVSKIKFRHPVPDVFSPRNFQADLGGDLNVNSSVWISSSISNDQIFRHSTKEDISLFRRHSTSELEGDAIVDEIINQQLISYTPLSQTHSEVKMVQSLLPIWEEQFRRTGVSEAIPPDSGKPSPQDVLRTLSDGIDFEKIMKFTSDANNESPFNTPESIKYSTDRKNLVLSGPDLVDKIESLVSLDSQPVDGLKTSDTDAADQLQISGTSRRLSQKASDEDALQLLKWLASSQAVQDINSDDELAVLSPLIPAKNMKKVLEKANLDYENESQQECQDILDSLDMMNFEESNSRASSSSSIEHKHTRKTLLYNKIPQMDGAYDDLQSTPCSNESLKTGTTSEASPELDPIIIHENKRKRSIWGSLPISRQKVTDVSSDNENKEGRIIECSTRELMRKKRSHRVEDKKDETCNNSESEKVDMNLDRKLNNFRERDSLCLPMYKPSVKSPSTFGNLPLYSSRDSVEPRNTPEYSNQESVVQLGGDDYCCDKLHGSVNNDANPTASSCIVDHARPLNNENFGKNFCCRDLMLTEFASLSAEPNLAVSDRMDKNDCPTQSDLHKIQEISPENSEDIETERNPGPSMPRISTSDNSKKEAESVKLIGRTFSRDPPVIEWTDEPSFQVRPVEDFPPFFSRDCQEDKKIQRFSPRKYEPDHPEPVMGIPVLYHNDGSYCYILTPSVSAPSSECVEKWLSLDNLRQKTKVLPSNGSSGNIMDSQADDVSSSPLVDLKPIIVTEKNPLTDPSQITGPDQKLMSTPLSQIGFHDPAGVGGGQQLTLLSVEVQSESRGDLKPDPRFDAINVIVLIFQEDKESMNEAHVLIRSDCPSVKRNLDALSGCKVHVFSKEIELFSHFKKVIRSFDPDIIMGWDVQSGSLGFLGERAANLGLGLLNNISRTPSETGHSEQKEMDNGIFHEKMENAESINLENSIIEDEWGRTHASGVSVTGRIVLNIWRLMRNEVKLNMYSAESVAEAVLRRKIPCFNSNVLTKWFSSGPGRARYKTIHYVLERAKLNFQIMNQLDMINRTSELARVFGIDFFSVLSRGSQYRVESMFLRLAHTQNYLAISPGNEQVANQPAMECLPLVMEPESNFYSDPVIVLDFQSLYPSMVIAYNLCFCTCLGKMMGTSLGVSSYSPDFNILRNLNREIMVTPNRVLYVSSKVRKGVLPRLLEEILSTRIMVKQAMKKLGPSEIVKNRIFNAQQLALKLIANVTYGYTAAGFSGRMPCAELADSIVQCGRRTLENAISFVNSNEKWKARVVYGDTDSMFVLLKGRSLKEAFAIGREIASAITEMNPHPVTLKMEKVYYPCFLLTKKRYVGYSYENPEQSKPTFDAKGIETVRRDTCGAVSKTMEKSLRIYFETQNIDEVKAYMHRQWTRILSGRVSLQDFIFAKEVRLGTYSARAHSLPPAAIVATKAMKWDPRSEPRYAERVPYVVVHGEPGARLLDMVADPFELININSPLRLNDVYYIRKQIIPALQRVFGLVGADLNRWFLDMPRTGRESVGKRHVTNGKRTRIDYYYLSKHCIICGELVQTKDHLCQKCSKDETTVAMALTGRTSKLEKDMQHLAAICRHCGGGDWHVESGVKCISLSCSVFYERRKVQKELQPLSQVVTKTGFYPKCIVEWF